MARSTVLARMPSATCTAPTVTLVRKAPVGWSRRNATGAHISSTSGMSAYRPPTMVGPRPSNASAAASTPSTSRGWQRSQT